VSEVATREDPAATLPWQRALVRSLLGRRAQLPHALLVTGPTGTGKRILAQTPSQKIDIIGHSMGGLIGLYYVKKLGGHARVRKLIMMGTPVRGTWAALAGVATLGLWSTSSWQLLPRSRFLDELAQGPIPPGVEVHTIAAARDWVVPLATTRLTGASATTVPLGHSSLVVSEEVYRRVVHTLRPPHEQLADQDPAATD